MLELRGQSDIGDKINALASVLVEQRAQGHFCAPATSSARNERVCSMAGTRPFCS
jgi:hypothetical protein